MAIGSARLSLSPSLGSDSRHGGALPIVGVVHARLTISIHRGDALSSDNLNDHVDLARGEPALPIGQRTSRM